MIKVYHYLSGINTYLKYDNYIEFFEYIFNRFISSFDDIYKYYSNENSPFTDYKFQVFEKSIILPWHLISRLLGHSWNGTHRVEIDNDVEYISPPIEAYLKHLCNHFSFTDEKDGIITSSVFNSILKSPSLQHIYKKYNILITLLILKVIPK